MQRFLIDVNLPYRFSLWSGDDCVHVRDIGETWTDTQIWQYARDRNMVIVSKDADFSDRVMVSVPPPQVVHIRLGNMYLRDLHRLLDSLWPRVVQLEREVLRFPASGYFGARFGSHGGRGRCTARCERRRTVCASTGRFVAFRPLGAALSIGGSSSMPGMGSGG